MACTFAIPVVFLSVFEKVSSHYILQTSLFFLRVGVFQINAPWSNLVILPFCCQETEIRLTNAIFACMAGDTAMIPCFRSRGLCRRPGGLCVLVWRTEFSSRRRRVRSLPSVYLRLSGVSGRVQRRRRARERAGRPAAVTNGGRFCRMASNKLTDVDAMCCAMTDCGGLHCGLVGPDVITTKYLYEVNADCILACKKNEKNWKLNLVKREVSKIHRLWSMFRILVAHILLGYSEPTWFRTSSLSCLLCREVHFLSLHLFWE